MPPLPRHSRQTQNPFHKEQTVLKQAQESLEKYRTDDPADLLKDFTGLIHNYENLLRETEKITSMGDLTMNKLVKSNDETARQKSDLEALLRQVSMQKLELQKAYKELDIISRTDPLTGLYNRREMLHRLEVEMARFNRSGRVFVLVILDMDDFKNINDTYGHECGDHVLKTTARLIRDGVRKQDVVSRWGGEEIMLLLPDTNLEQGLRVAEIQRSSIDEFQFHHQQITCRISATFGVSQIQSGQTIDDCLRASDKALYEGKSKGKNCIVIHRESRA